MTECHLLPPDDPNAFWTFCPSLPAAILFTTLFSLTTTLHIHQSLSHRTPFAWVLIMGSLWESFSFLSRCISIKHLYSIPPFDIQYILILLAPLWINAFDYMVLGRMVWYFLGERRLVGIRAERMAMVFVGLDMSSFAIQIVGGMITISNDMSTLNTGLHIYTAGVVLQECVILAFVYLVWRFWGRARVELADEREGGREKLREAKKLVFVLFLSLGLISFRIVFRIIEFSAGAGSALTAQFRNHEIWTYVFDALPMFCALVGMNIIHPGKVLGGRSGEEGRGIGYPSLRGRVKARWERRRKEKEGKREEDGTGTGTGTGLASSEEGGMVVGGV